MKEIVKLIASFDYAGIRNLLSKDPALANEEIPLFDGNPEKAHPLHRICDGVFAVLYTDVQAVEIAKIFLAFGAKVDGNKLQEKKDSPLVAAASLHADEVAILYIENGANIHHGGCFGGTALHWAAWCGRDKVVKRLLHEKPDVNKKCIDHKATPLFWAIHGYKNGGEKNRHHQIECARLLIKAGADKTIPNIDGHKPIEILDKADIELIELLT